MAISNTDFNHEKNKNEQIFFSKMTYKLYKTKEVLTFACLT